MGLPQALNIYPISGTLRGTASRSLTFSLPSYVSLHLYFQQDLICRNVSIVYQQTLLKLKEHHTKSLRSTRRGELLYLKRNHWIKTLKLRKIFTNVNVIWHLSLIVNLWFQKMFLPWNICTFSSTAARSEYSGIFRPRNPEAAEPFLTACGHAEPTIQEISDFAQ